MIGYGRATPPSQQTQPTAAINSSFFVVLFDFISFVEKINEGGGLSSL